VDDHPVDALGLHEASVDAFLGEAERALSVSVDSQRTRLSLEGGFVHEVTRRALRAYTKGEVIRGSGGAIREGLGRRRQDPRSGASTCAFA